MNPSEPLPSLGLSLTDVQVLSTLLSSYLVYLRRGVAPSRERDTQIGLLADMHQRMLAMLATEGGMMLLTAAEIQALASALQDSARLMRRMMPPSEGRDEAVKQMKAIREHLLGMLVGKKT